MRRTPRRASPSGPLWLTLTLATLVLLIFVIALVAASPAQAFSDVPAEDAFSQAITDLASRGVVSGFDGGAFGPALELSRQQFAKIVVVGLGLPVSEADICPFTDVANGGPATLYPDNYIAAAARFGLVHGKSATRFDPYAPISRAQLVSILARAMENPVLFPRKSLTPPPDYKSALGDFSPSHAANWRSAEYNGLLHGLTGYGIHWDPWAKVSRGEAAQLLWNLLELRARPARTVSESGLGATPERIFPSRILGLSGEALSWIRLRAEPSYDFRDTVYEPVPESVQSVSLSADSWSPPHLVPGPPAPWPALVQRGDDLGWVFPLGGSASELPATGIWVAKTSGEDARILSPTTAAFRSVPAFSGSSVYWTELEGTTEDILAGRSHIRLVRAPLSGGLPETLSEGTLYFGGVLASSTYVVWMEGEGDGGAVIFHVYDIGQGKEVDSWESPPQHVSTDQALSVEGDFYLYQHWTSEHDAQGNLYRRREFRLRHLPSGRDMPIAAPPLVQLWGGGPIGPGEEMQSTGLLKAGLSGDVLWGADWTRRYYDQGITSDPSWTLWARDISLEKELLASSAPLPSTAPAPSALARTICFGGPGSTFIDAQVATGRFAWAVQENNRQRIYLIAQADAGLGE